MVTCLFELLVIVLLATVPAICAIFQSISVIPRRRDNITSLVQSALSPSEERPDEGTGPETQRSLSPRDVLASHQLTTLLLGVEPREFRKTSARSMVDLLLLPLSS
jgi:hypothetical protein